VRTHPIRHHAAASFETAFLRLKGFRRIANRYDKLATNFASAWALATIVVFWC
jgi:transposase